MTPEHLNTFSAWIILLACLAGPVLRGFNPFSRKRSRKTRAKKTRITAASACWFIMRWIVSINVGCYVMEGVGLFVGLFPGMALGVWVTLELATGFTLGPLKLRRPEKSR